MLEPSISSIMFHLFLHDLSNICRWSQKSKFVWFIIFLFNLHIGVLKQIDELNKWFKNPYVDKIIVKIVRLNK